MILNVLYNIDIYKIYLDQLHLQVFGKGGDIAMADGKVAFDCHQALM